MITSAPVNKIRKFFNTVMQLLFFICIHAIPFFFIHTACAQPTSPVAPGRMISSFAFEQLYGGGILLRGKLGDYPDSLNFILDTGSGGISLDSATAAGLEMAIVPTDVRVNGVGGQTKAGFIYAQQLRLPGLTIDSLDFHVTDYELLTRFYGVKINGLIGYSVLKNYVVELDFDSSRISFYSKGPVKYPRGGYLLKPFINFQPFQSASLKDSRKIQSNFIFDIGANVCLMLSSDFDNDSTPIKTYRKRFIKAAGGVGGKIAIQTTVIREFKLGPYRFTDVPVYVFDDLCNVTTYPYGAGIIGNGLLRRFNIILNYGNKEIFLEPNSHFWDPFDYSYTGIELCFEQGSVIISDITAGSPAEKAGLKQDDIVISINNTFGQSLSVLKDALLKATGNVRFIIKRTGTVMEFHLKAKSIL
jgi:Aspartyl protease/PDZ domain